MPEPAAPNQTPNPEPKAEGTPVEAPKRKATAQERIAQLYGQNAESKERLTAVEAEKQQLQTQLLQAQEQIQTLQSRTRSDPLEVPGAVVDPVSGSPDLKQEIRSALQEVVGPEVQALRQMREQQALMAAIRESEARAITKMPELSDPTSELTQLTAEVLRRDPAFFNDPNGVEKAAIFAKGLLSGDGTEVPANVPTQKKAAASGAPQVGTGPDPVSAPANTKEALETALEEVYKGMRECHTAAERQPFFDKRNQIKDQLRRLAQQQNQ
jgi:hypothetical protein